MRSFPLSYKIASKTIFDGKGGYSLVELLTVISVMAICATLTFTSIQTSDAARLTAAGNTITDTMNWARQNSMTKRAYTAIVVKTVSDGAYSSYCLLQLQSNPDGSYGSWTPLTPWRGLPQGIYFCSDSQVTDNFLNASDIAPVALPASFPFRGHPVDLSNVSIFHIYQPDGSLTTNQEVRLRLLQGALDPTHGTVVPRQINGNGSLNQYDVLILRDTGQINIEHF